MQYACKLLCKWFRNAFPYVLIAIPIRASKQYLDYCLPTDEMYLLTNDQEYAQGGLISTLKPNDSLVVVAIALHDFDTVIPLDCLYTTSS